MRDRDSSADVKKPISAGRSWPARVPSSWEATETAGRTRPDTSTRHREGAPAHVPRRWDVGTQQCARVIPRWGMTRTTTRQKTQLSSERQELCNTGATLPPQTVNERTERQSRFDSLATGRTFRPHGRQRRSENRQCEICLRRSVVDSQQMLCSKYMGISEPRSHVNCIMSHVTRKLRPTRDDIISRGQENVHTFEQHCEKERVEKCTHEVCKCRPSRHDTMSLFHIQSFICGGTLSVTNPSVHGSFGVMSDCYFLLSIFHTCSLLHFSPWIASCFVYTMLYICLSGWGLSLISYSFFPS